MHGACCSAGGEAEVVLKIASMSTRERYKLSDALGVERGDNDRQCLLLLVREIATFFDNFIKAFTGLTPCHAIVDPCCLRMAVSRKLADELNRHLIRDKVKHSALETDHKTIVQALVASDNRILHHFTQMYWEHVLGFRRKYDDSYFSNRPLYTLDQIRNIEDAFAALKFDTYTDPMFAEKLIRVLNVGGPDYEIHMPCLYERCVKLNPCYTCCFRGCSRSSHYTKELILYLYMNRVPYDRVIYALQNFEETEKAKGLWYSYLGEFIHVGVTKGLETTFSSTIDHEYIRFFEEVGIEDLYRYEVSENLRSAKLERANSASNDQTLATTNPISLKGKLKAGSWKAKSFEGVEISKD